jgi:neutral ceramidase
MLWRRQLSMKFPHVVCKKTLFVDAKRPDSERLKLKRWEMKRWFETCCAVGFVVLALSCAKPAPKAPPPALGDCAGNTTFLIGSGIYDITGPAAERGMMGYARLDQQTAGIHTRLWSRAFVMASPCNNHRVVFVSADLQMISQAVKLKVVDKLEKKYKDLYTAANVLLSATHTHSGPGGFSHYALYNLTTQGFDKQNFNVIVDGIYQSIVRAHENLAPGTISMAMDTLLHTSINRSQEAYTANPEAERAQYQYDTDKKMTVLKLAASTGQQIGMINWFAVHTTSMGNANRLISSDNKGFASHLFERLKNSDYTAEQAFVAAFAQSNEGDVSPNIYGGTAGGGPDDFASTDSSGRKQFRKALALYNTATELLAGGINYRHSYVDFSNVTVAPQWTDGVSAHKTCPAAIGMSMIAGAEDGPGFGKEGWDCNDVKDFWPVFVCTVLPNPCQGDKPVILQTGTMQPEPWTPQILPVQIVTIGKLAILAVPAEFTTTAGRRLRQTVLAQLQSHGIAHVVIAGLANAYAGYVTTKEEYGEQHYEGASTHFGPWTLAAYQQEFNRLALALRNNTPVDPGPQPPDVSSGLIDLQAKVVNDDKPADKEFGSVHIDAKSVYKRGDTVSVTFWGGHPKNDLKTQSTYLEVQRKNGASWETVARDWDPETKYIWKREQVAYSLVTIEWTIPDTTRTGIYRIRHDGNRKKNLLIFKKIYLYAGFSREFTVN